MVDEEKVKSKLSFLNLLKKRGKQVSESGLPPGQRLVKHFPVLDLGKRPEIDTKTWKLEIRGCEKDVDLSLEDLKKLGVQYYSEDFHCVTQWSKIGVQWSGIPFKKILELVRPKKSWNFLIQYGSDGYSTNVPRIDVERDDVFIAFELDGTPIPREHGTIRFIIPHLYGWKGSKFLSRLEFSSVDKPGFWEVRGYHNHGDVVKEER